LFLAKSCARQESCLSPQGEFSPDNRMSLNVKEMEPFLSVSGVARVAMHVRTTGEEQRSKKHPRQPPFLGPKSQAISFDRMISASIINH